MAYLAAQGYASLTLRDLSEIGGHVPERAVVITFDDAYACVRERAFPILQRYGFVATVFAIAGYVGEENGWDVRFPGMRSRHLDWHGLKELLAAGWEVGSHSMTHPKLTALPEDGVWQELHGSKVLLEDALGTPIVSFSYPFGRYDRRIMNLAQKAGYRYGCTLDGRSFSSPTADGFLISRRGVYLLDDMRSFKRKVDSRDYPLFERRKQQVIHFCAQGTWWAKTLLKKQKELAIF
jgi:peptidoglycan/xylan/chitin deacetylase (PgdA/CDA1 family)